jgi:membrane-associated phospholipid phosphatase
MKKLLSIYITGFIIFGIILLTFPKGALVLYINNHFTPFLDFFFKYITHLGNGIMFIVVGLYLWAFKQRVLKELFFTAFIQAIFVNVFKRILFPGNPRPKAFYGDIVPLHFVDGVTVHNFNSFPSGHTATAFGIAMLLAITIFKIKPIGQLFVFFLAFLVAYSRMYLLQHFFIDVWFGSLLGIGSTLIAVWVLQQLKMYRFRLFQQYKSRKNNPVFGIRSAIPFNRFI